MDPRNLYPCRSKAVTLWCRRTHVIPGQWQKCIESFHELNIIYVSVIDSLNLSKAERSVSFVGGMAVMVGCNKHNRLIEKRSIGQNANKLVWWSFIGLRSKRLGDIVFSNMQMNNQLHLVAIIHMKYPSNIYIYTHIWGNDKLCAGPYGAREPYGSAHELVPKVLKASFLIYWEMT